MGTTSVREIQQALKDKGFDPSAIDGVFGARRPCLKSPLIQLGHSQYRPR